MKGSGVRLLSTFHGYMIRWDYDRALTNLRTFFDQSINDIKTQNRKPMPLSMISSAVFAICSGLTVMPSESHFFRSPMHPALTKA